MPTDRERDFWERAAAHYDRVTTGLFGRPLPRARELAAAGAAGAATVLEVAAGTGLMTEVLAPRVGRLVATDYAENMLARLRERVENRGLTNVEIAHRDLYALDFPPASFDVVVAGNVLHLVPDLDGALDALCRMLRPGGRLIVPTFVHRETLLAAAVSRGLALVVGQPMRRRFSAASLRQALEDRALRIERAEVIPGLIPLAYVEAVLENAR